MNFKLSTFSKAILMVAALAILAPFAGAQSQVASRITQAVDNTRTVTLTGNTHPMARPEFDRGRVSDSMPLHKMVLVLQRSPEQQASLRTLLDAQHDRTSANYHKWLTPQEFGQQFGPSDSDMQTVTGWLQSQGFSVDKVSNGRTVIQFSGDAGLVRSAFHTEIHNYMVRGVNHIANASDPQIPAALAPVIRGVASLHNFFMHPELVRQAQPVKVHYEPGKSVGHLTFSAGDFALGPGDFAKIYNIPSNATGSGKTIAIVGRSNINISDVTDFQNIFALTANPPTIVLNGPDPGDLGGGEEIEALLDNEWANAISNGAAIKFVISESTETDDGVMLSAQYIVDNNIADIMTQSFGACEAGLNQVEAAEIAAIPEQAAAQGISYFASTGDAGAADCDNPDSEETATQPISVDVPGATPFVTAVGGTQFNEHGDDSAYWNPSTSVLVTALKYIPEDVWNQSCAAGASGCTSPNIGAGGGGVSAVYDAANGFPKPAWQAGVTGIAADNARELPDVSLNASAAHDPYLVCQGGGCVPDSQGEIELNLVGGTSASTPSFAGIMALVDNHQNSREGLANYVLYKLAATETFSGCNGSSTTATIGSTCIFNDVTVGNNAVPGETGYGTGSAKYQATVGYDAASGLGSVNVANLISNWSSATFLASTTTLALSSASFTHGTPVTASGTITTGGSNAPTGDVAFLATGTTLAGVGDITLSGGSGTTTNYSTSIADLPGGSYTVTARYAGDTHVAASVSNAVPVVVSPETSTTAVSILDVNFVAGTFQPVSSAPVGSNIFVRVDVAGASGQGVPTGKVNLVDALGNKTTVLNLNSSGYAELQTTSLAKGNHSFVATYVGDPSFTTSTSAAATLSVVAGSFSMGLSPNSGTIASAGGSTTSTVTVSDTNGFAGSVALSCSVSGSGTQPTCSLNKSSVDLSEATTSATATLTVTAPASTRVVWPFHFPGMMGLIAATLGLILTTTLFWMAAPARKRLSTVLALIVFGTIIGMSACGGGSSSGGGGGGSTGSTFKVTVTGTSGSSTATQTFTVTAP